MGRPEQVSAGAAVPRLPSCVSAAKTQPYTELLTLNSSFIEALSQLRSPACGVCRLEIGSASCFDEEPYERLGSLYAEAVAALTATDGPPLDPTPPFPGVDVERAACWRRERGVVYVLLSWADNTRIRVLTLGLARPGTVVAGVWS